MTASCPELELSDDELMCRVAGGQTATGRWSDSQTCFEQLYHRHAPRLLAFLAARVPRRNLEDVHQVVWQRVWQRTSQYQGGNFRAWIHQIARNYLIDLRRRKDFALFNGTEHDPPAQELPPEESIIELERMEILRNCLGKLNAEMADLVRARLSGDSYDVICARMDLKPSRAHKMFHDAKTQLAHCVGHSDS